MSFSPMTAGRPSADGCEFASFWHGTLNPFAYACLASFAQAGASLRVFSYDPRLDLPPGVRLEDASAICPDQSLTRRFIANGKPSIATFADMFRYRMIRDRGYCWVDTDILCLTQAGVRQRRRDLLPPGRRGRDEPRQQRGIEAPAVASGDRRTRRHGRGRDRRRPAMGRARPVPADAGPDEIRSLRLRARFACLLPDRARAVLEAVPAGISGLGRTRRRAARPSCICGAKRSCGAATISGPARPPAPICTKRSGASARSTASAAIATER